MRSKATSLVLEVPPANTKCYEPDILFGQKAVGQSGIFWNLAIFAEILCERVRSIASPLATRVKVFRYGELDGCQAA